MVHKIWNSGKENLKRGEMSRKGFLHFSLPCKSWIISDHEIYFVNPKISDTGIIDIEIHEFTCDQEILERQLNDAVNIKIIFDHEMHVVIKEVSEKSQVMQQILN